MKFVDELVHECLQCRVDETISDADDGCSGTANEYCVPVDHSDTPNARSVLITAMPMKYPAMQQSEKMSTAMVYLLSENIVDADQQHSF
jgi:hypothetical protein